MNVSTRGFFKMPKYYRSCRGGVDRSSDISTLESLSELEEMREV